MPFFKSGARSKCVENFLIKSTAAPNKENFKIFLSWSWILYSYQVLFAIHYWQWIWYCEGWLISGSMQTNNNHL